MSEYLYNNGQEAKVGDRAMLVSTSLFPDNNTKDLQRFVGKRVIVTRLSPTAKICFECDGITMKDWYVKRFNKANNWREILGE